MCGIAGIFEYGWSSGNVEQRALVEMRESLRHRGPDGEGLFISEDRRVGLAHRRLAIVDVLGGSQPMAGAQGEMLVFNGEIYGYPRLRRQLESEGVKFRTNCDTEIILHLYKRYGRACLDYMDGMFAFAIWDPGKGEVFFARDRVGEKPFYWTSVGGRFIFGSEIKAILAHPAVTAEVNEEQIGPYLTNLVTSSPQTLYKSIQKLPPGTAGVCSGKGVQVFRYGQVTETREINNCSESEASETVRDLLDRSVHDRLMSDVPVGVLLSGGLDSSAIVALLSDRAQDLATFSVGFQGQSETDERGAARRVAKHFGTDHHEVEISGNDAKGFLTSLVHHQDEPLADPVCIPLHFVCGLAAQNDVKVVMAGEGADELFWGYPSYSRVLSHERELRTLLTLPKPVRKLLYELSKGRKPRLRELMDGIARGRPLPIHMPLGLTRLQREEILNASQPFSSGWAPSDVGPDEDPIETLFWDTQEYEFSLRLPELLLMRIDRFSMANSIEARVPFLSPDLVDFAYSLPLHHKLKDGVTKRVMKESIADILPPWVLNQPKRGFGAPVEEWLAGDMQSSLERLMKTDSIRCYFDVSSMQKILSSGGRKGRQARWSIWSIFNFALWHRYWIEGVSEEEVIPSTATELL